MTPAAAQILTARRERWSAYLLARAEVERTNQRRLDACTYRRGVQALVVTAGVHAAALDGLDVAIAGACE